MAKSLYEDWRARIIAAVEGGLSRRAAAARVDIAAASAVHAQQQGGERDHIALKPIAISP